MSLSDTQWEFLQDLAKLIEFAKAQGFKLTGGELRRTEEQQHLYLVQKKSKTLNSDHLLSLAIDLNIFYDYDNDGDKDFLQAVLPTDKVISIAIELGDYWKSLHPKNYVGMDWGWDVPHFGRKA